jgi:hypothetical protein
MSQIIHGLSTETIVAIVGEGVVILAIVFTLAWPSWRRWLYNSRRTPHSMSPVCEPRVSCSRLTNVTDPEIAPERFTRLKAVVAKPDQPVNTSPSPLLLAPRVKSDPDAMVSIVHCLLWARSIKDRAKVFLQQVVTTPATFLSSAGRSLLSAVWRATPPWTIISLTTVRFISMRLRQSRKTQSSISLRVASLMVVSTSIPNAAAHSGAAAPTTNWKQRAMGALTDAVAFCALMSPTVIIFMIGWLITDRLLRKKAEYVLGILMSFMALFYLPKGETIGPKEFRRTVTGILYMLFMFGYCRRIILRNKKDKGTSAVAIILGLVIGWPVLAFASVRDFVENTMDIAPPCIFAPAFPVGFLLCDLYLHITKPHQNRSRAGSRRRAGYDNDAEEYDLGGYGEGDASQPAPRASTPVSGNWFSRLFTKTKAS